MPYRNLSPLRRPWWEKLTGLWMITLSAMGVAGLAWPSVTLSSGLGHGQVAYSVLLIALGVAAFVAWWKGERAPEFAFMLGLAILTALYGLGLWLLAPGGTGAQTGIRIIAAAIGTLAWIGVRREFGMSRTQIQEAVTHMEGIRDKEG